MKKKILWTGLLLTVFLFAGCGKEAEQKQENIQEEEAPEAPEILPEEPAAEEEAFTFAEVKDREFFFSSGAGGWYTVLYIHEDGTFDGHYQDSNLGDWAPEHPNGTIYYSEFSGRFTEPVKVEEKIWSFEIASITYPLGMGEEIKDGCHYCYVDAYGLEGAKELRMYLPGAEIAGLPEGFRSWVGYYDLENVSEKELPFYGLYNVEMEEGFSSYEYTVSGMVQEAIALAEELAGEQEKVLQMAQSQGDMNVAAEELYQIWDNALNGIWSLLKTELDEEAFASLLEEQRSWIARKESAMEEAKAEAEGGSLSPLLCYSEGAELTRERVYELSEYVK